MAPTRGFQGSDAGNPAVASLDLDQMRRAPKRLKGNNAKRRARMSTTTEADFEALQAELKQLRGDLARLNETVRDFVRHGSAEAVNRARESGEKLWGEAKKRASTVTDEIEEKPITAAITAFGLGVVLGMLFSNRR